MRKERRNGKTNYTLINGNGDIFKVPTIAEKTERI